MSQRFCLACDLDDDAAAIAEYERWHRVGQTPPAIIASIRSAGIRDMEIFRIGHRLVMVIDADDAFSFDRKAAMDAADPAVVDWEARMSVFQRPLAEAADGEKWLHMARIFSLSDHPA